MRATSNWLQRYVLKVISIFDCDCWTIQIFVLNISPDYILKRLTEEQFNRDLHVLLQSWPGRRLVCDHIVMLHRHTTSLTVFWESRVRYEAPQVWYVRIYHERWWNKVADLCGSKGLRLYALLSAIHHPVFVESGVIIWFQLLNNFDLLDLRRIWHYPRPMFNSKRSSPYHPLAHYPWSSSTFLLFNNKCSPQYSPPMEGMSVTPGPRYHIKPFVLDF